MKIFFNSMIFVIRRTLDALARHRIASAWLFWACAMMSNAFVGVLLESFIGKTGEQGRDPLKDVGFELLPYIPARSLGISIPDICSLGSATVLAFGIVLFVRPEFATILLRRILIICGIAYCGRTISIPQTLLPNPDPECVPRLHPDSFVLSVILIPFGSTVTCMDVFYSGHTIPITCAILAWVDYLRPPFRAIRLAGIALSCFSLSGILMTHFHYTVDVFYGAAVTVAVWKLYHFALSCPSVFYYFKSLVWWESSDALSECPPPRIPSGVFPIDWSRDPRLTWSFEDKKIKLRDHQGLSRSQLMLLVVVALTLSPSWVAVYQGT